MKRVPPLFVVCPPTSTVIGDKRRPNARAGAKARSERLRVNALALTPPDVRAPIGTIRR